MNASPGVTLASAAEVAEADGIALDGDSAAPGQGTVVVRQVNGRSVVIQSRAQAPLKLLLPRDEARLARLVVSSFGGGIVAGDRLSIDLDIGADCTVLLSTQASTKVFRSGGPVAHQQVRAKVAAGAVLAVVPDPVTCFAAARYDQKQRFDLDGGASMLLVDLLTSGRWACGERWAFTAFASSIDVDVDGRPLWRERLVLEAREGSLTAPLRCGHFECLGTVLITGPALAGLAAQVLNTVSRMPVDAGDALPMSAGRLGAGSTDHSPADQRGSAVLLRVAGPSAEACVQRIRSLCADVADVLGTDPWARKW